MREGFGGVPSNFTCPDNEAGASAGGAEPGETLYDKNVKNHATGTMSAKVMFFIAKSTFRPRYLEDFLSTKSAG